MTTVLATLGFAPLAILPTVRTGGVNRAIVFYFGKGKESKLAVEGTTKGFVEVGIPCQMNKLRDGYDFALCFEEMVAAAREAQAKHPAEEVIFDITGGTKVMAVAAFSAAHASSVKPPTRPVAARG